MKKSIQRLLIFITGIPIITALVLFLPQLGHLALNIAVVIFSALGALEFRNMLKEKQLVVTRIEAIVLGALCPALMTLIICLDLNFLVIPVFIIAAAFWLLVSSVFMSHLENYINRITAGFGVLIYPGFFLAWICAMGKWNGILIIIFLLIPLLADATAWAAGMLFGKNNRGIVKVSPNKSIAGFAGGLFAAVLVSTVSVFLFPSYFIPRVMPALPAAIILGFIPGICSALGDLCESAIKRSAGVKDSGTLIPGRGGILDSVDSIALAAPSFFFIWTLLFTRA